MLLRATRACAHVRLVRVRARRRADRRRRGVRRRGANVAHWRRRCRLLAGRRVARRLCARRRGQVTGEGRARRCCELLRAAGGTWRQLTASGGIGHHPASLGSGSMGNWRQTLAPGGTWHRLAPSGSGRLGTWRHWRQLEASGISCATFHTFIRQLPGGLLGPWSSLGSWVSVLFNASTASG